MASLISVPKEIRNIIYSHCDLVVDVEIIPYPTSHERDSAQYQCEQPYYPSVALLGVNHQIRTEAMEVIFTKNTWRLPSGPIDWGNFHLPPGPDLLRNIFFKHPKHFLSITVVFNQHDLPNDEKSQISRRTHSYPRHDYTPTARIVDIHAQYLEKIEAQWANKAYLLCWTLLTGQVQSVVVDLEELACPSGCCRLQLLHMDESFFKHFLQYLLPSALAKGCAQHNRTVPKVTVKGLLNQQERFLIGKVYEFSTDRRSSWEWYSDLEQY